MNRHEKYLEIERAVSADPSLSDFLENNKKIQQLRSGDKDEKREYKLPFSSEPTYRGHRWNQ